MSEQKATDVSRVIVPADRGDLAESALLSVAENLTRRLRRWVIRRFKACWAPTFRSLSYSAA